MITRGILIDADNAGGEKETNTQLFVKTAEGMQVFLEKEFKPYFYVIAPEQEKAMKELREKSFGEEKAKILKIEKAKKENAENVLKLSFASTQGLTAARHEIKEMGLERREYDIPFAKRFLIDRQLEPMNYYEIEYAEEDGKKILKKTTPLSKELDIPLETISIDLETLSPERFSNPEKDPILMISCADEKESVVFSWHKELKDAKGLKVFETEKRMLEAFIDFVKKKKPDMIVTYNGDLFDFPYLKERGRKLGVKVDLGFAGEEPKAKKKGIETAVRLEGIQHIDAYQLILLLSRFTVVNLVKFDLESVSQQLFGKEKAKIKAVEINEIWRTGKGLQELVEYNREDSETALEIVRAYFPLLVELCKLVKQPLFEISRSSASQLVEFLLINEAFKRNALVPNKPSEGTVKQRMLSTFKGGYVKEPIAGLHENIAVLDFSSLHPTIIISHNISPETLKCGHEKCRAGKNISPDKDWFCETKKGFLPAVLKQILETRMALKKQLKAMDKKDKGYPLLDARQHALKILLNSHYGYLGYARARWYSMESARAITAWSRHYIRETMHKAEAAGFRALYSDSISGERLVTILNPKGFIEIRKIEELFDLVSSQPFERNGKEVKDSTGYKALSVNAETKEAEWAEIREVIRHKTSKALFRVVQKFGETIVTEDHSLLVLENGNLVRSRPKELGDKPLFKVWKIPAANTVKKIDLFDEMQKYEEEIVYKKRRKTAAFRKDRDSVWFGWMNMKQTIKFRRFFNVESEEFEALCRLLGAYIAEGSSSTAETTKTRKGASIASSNKAWLYELQKDYNRLFSNTKTCVIPSTKKQRNLTYKNKNATKSVKYFDLTHKLQMMNAASALFFKMLCGQKSYGKKLPSFIFNVPDKYKRIMLEKIIEGDGSHSVNKRLGYTKEYIEKNFSITTKSLSLISGLSLLLLQLGINYSMQYREEKKVYTIKTSTKTNNRLQTKISKEENNGFVYDLAVEKNNNFVDACGQVLLHNTDSCFLEIPQSKTRKDVEGFLAQIDKELPEAMQLDLEGYYKRGIFVSRREGTAVAKKRYALIDYNDKLKIVGFEYVRRDWSNIAKETQKEVIEAALKEGNPEKAVQIVRKKIELLKSGKVPKKELVVLTQIKRPLDKYETIGPHTAAAAKAIKRGKELEVGSVVGYIITRNGASISERAELEEYVKEGNYDADYYIEHQLIPAIIMIIQELGYSKDDLLHGGKQKTLGSFG